MTGAVIKSRDGDVQCQRPRRCRRVNQGVFDWPYMYRLCRKGKTGAMAQHRCAEQILSKPGQAEKSAPLVLDWLLWPERLHCRSGRPGADASHAVRPWTRGPEAPT